MVKRDEWTDRQRQILMPPDYRHGGIKKILAVGRRGGGCVARVSDFYFQKNPSQKKKFFMRG